MKAHRDAIGMLSYLELVLDLEGLTHSEVDGLTRIVSQRVDRLAAYASAFIRAGEARVTESQQLADLPKVLTEWALGVAGDCRSAFGRRSAALDVARDELTPAAPTQTETSSP